MAKVRYKMRNWSEYNRTLVNRYRLELWLSEGLARGWYARGDSGGAFRRYEVSHHGCGRSLAGGHRRLQRRERKTLLGHVPA